MIVDKKEIITDMCVENLMKVLDHYDIEIDDYKKAKIKNEFHSFTTDMVDDIIDIYTN